MATSWEHQREVREALRTIVTDPQLGGMTGLTHREFCATKESHIGLDAYQFTSAAAFSAGLSRWNNLTGWNAGSAGTGCPPPSGSNTGQTQWHSNVNTRYRARAGQVLECYPYHGYLLYVWTMPTQRVILVANDNAAWHVPGPLPVPDLIAQWRNLEYVHQGRTNMGAAFHEVSEALGPSRLERRTLRPAILLITDGLPTDPPGGFEADLAELTSSAAGRASLRVAVAIGRDASSEPLDRFRSPDAPILVADSTDEIADRLVAASIAVSRMSEEGANREDLAQTLMHPPVGHAPASHDDSIL